MWFALTVVGIWGFTTLGAYITKEAGIYALSTITTITLAIGYLIYKLCKLGEK